MTTTADLVTEIANAIDAGGAAAATSDVDPSDIYDLASRCRRHGRMDLWHRAIECALALPHHSHQQLSRRGEAKLLLGQWSGWLDRESRIYDPTADYLSSRFVRQLRYNVRAWDGREDLAGRSLFVLADGSAGDSLQMLRYIPLLRSRVGRLVVSVQPEVISLIRQMYGRSLTLSINGADDGTSYDRYAWMLSLPALLGELPPFSPLPVATIGRPPRPRAETANIGICCTGDADLGDDLSRSSPIDMLASLLERDTIQWWSLQAPATIPQPLAAKVRQPTAARFTLAQKAQVVAGCDAVISVDSTVAHLSAAVGVPTWLMLQAEADPRWGIASTTPWYPSMRVCRQVIADDWSAVCSEITVAMDASAWHGPAV